MKNLMKNKLVNISDEAGVKWNEFNYQDMSKLRYFLMTDEIYWPYSVL
jgi:hypothetical protein